MTETQRNILKALIQLQRSRSRRQVIPASVMDCYDWRSTKGLMQRGYVEAFSSDEYRVTDAGKAAA